MEKFPSLSSPPHPGSNGLNDLGSTPANGNGDGNGSINGNGNGNLNGYPAANTWSASGRSHTRQKSLGDAFRTIRARKGSMSQNAHEIADALRAPVSPKLVVCHALSSCMIFVMQRGG
jgi:solute carrier family 35 protein E1